MNRCFALKAVCLLLGEGLLLMTGCATSYKAGARDGAVDVIAHRGASAYAPENTMASFRLAAEMGADWFELDCGPTKDGAVVVIHDNTVDRTTNGQGRIAAMTLDEVQALDAGAWKGPQFSGARIPTLAEALDFAHERIGVYIEIKSCGNDPALLARLEAELPAAPWTANDLAWALVLVEQSDTADLVLTHDVLALVRERGMEHQVVVQSFSPVVCLAALAEGPDIRVELLGSDDKDKPEQWQRFLHWSRVLAVAGCNISMQSGSQERIDAFHASGKSVAVWTVNDPIDFDRLVQWGVDAIITDRPDLCLDVLNRSSDR